MARVLPIFKSGDKSYFSKYRSVSVVVVVVFCFVYIWRTIN